MISLLSLLVTAQLVAPDVPLTPAPLNTVKIPQLLFFCTSTAGERKIFALEVEHDPTADVIRIGRTPGRSDLLFEGPIGGAAMHNIPERMLVKLSSENAVQHSRADVLLTVAKTVSADFNLITPKSSYAATCHSVPVPPRPERSQ
jgi:hypothetical protein